MKCVWNKGALVDMGFQRLRKVKSEPSLTQNVQNNETAQDAQGKEQPVLVTDYKTEKHGNWNNL